MYRAASCPVSGSLRLVAMALAVAIACLGFGPPALGTTYTFDPSGAQPLSDQRGDPNRTKLLDGLVDATANWDSSRWVGFQVSSWPGGPIINFDLGASLYINRLNLTYLVDHDGSLHAPDIARVTLSNSADFSSPLSFTSFTGFNDAPDPDRGQRVGEVRTAAIDLTPATARYARVQVQTTGGPLEPWIFLGEAAFSPMAPQYLVARDNPRLAVAQPTALGAFGINTSVDPFFYQLPPTFANVVETQTGWQAVQQTTYYVGDQVLKGQWSRIGTTGGEIRILGVGIQENDWRQRSLLTSSEGSFTIQGLTGQTVPLKVKLDYDVRLDGTAWSQNAAIVVNLIPTTLSFAATQPYTGTMELLGWVAKQVATNLTTTQEIVAVESNLAAESSAHIMLYQEGVSIAPPLSTGYAYLQQQPVGGLGTLLRTHTATPSGEWTVNVDPSKPVQFDLDFLTRARAIGTAQMYVGITRYRLRFETADELSVPLVFEQRDPLPPHADFYNGLLLGAANTPELTTGVVETRSALGNVAPRLGEELVVLSNSQPSGFMIPVLVSGTDTCLTLGAGAMVSDEALAGDVALQIGFLQGETCYELYDRTLKEIFRSFESTSGISSMPYWSGFSTLEIDIGELPEGEGIFVIAFGNLVASDLQANIVIDSMSQVPEPATLSLLALGGLAVLRRRAQVGRVSPKAQIIAWPLREGRPCGPRARAAFLSWLRSQGQRNAISVSF